MFIRILDGPDADRYRALHREALQDSPESFGGDLEGERALVTGQLAQSLRPGPNGFVLGAFEGDGQLVGATGFGLGRDGRKRSTYGVLWGMYVRREFRRAGVARALLQRLVEEARALGHVRSIRLRVVAGNVPARTLYAVAGFRTTGIDHAAFELAGRSYDEEWMELRLR